MSEKFQLTLEKNGIHSLIKGLDTFEVYEESKSDFNLKESIMFLNHGIELLMKQILIEKVGEYLIYSDINKAVNKVIEAKSKNTTVFNLDEPVHTATYTQVLDRIRAFIDSPILSKKTNKTEKDGLFEFISDLNKIRNQIEHYGIDKERNQIENLLKDLKAPLIKYFEEAIPDFKEKYSTFISAKWNDLNKRISDYQKLEEDVFDMLKKFNGQTLDGKLLEIDNEIKLPKFDNVTKNHRISGSEIDIFGEETTGNWVIEVKGKTKNLLTSSLDLIENNMKETNSKYGWLIVFDDLTPSNKSRLINHSSGKNIFISDLKDWNKIKEIIK